MSSDIAADPSVLLNHLGELPIDITTWLQRQVRSRETCHRLRTKAWRKSHNSRNSRNSICSWHLRLDPIRTEVKSTELGLEPYFDLATPGACLE